jgi:predicted RNA-binding protein YlxR (DUF448 family)
MCVGCRVTADKVDLLRVVVADGFLSPDPRAKRPGRGAYLHPDPGCLEAAERRRAFVRAFRLAGPLDAELLRAFVAEHGTTSR